MLNLQYVTIAASHISVYVISLLLPLSLYSSSLPSFRSQLLHSCCSNPLWQLPALHSVESPPPHPFLSLSLSLCFFLPSSLLSVFAYLTLSYTFFSTHLLRLRFSATTLHFFSLSLCLRSLFSLSSLSLLFIPHQRGTEVAIQPQRAANAKAQADEALPSSANQALFLCVCVCVRMGKP